MRKMNFIYVGLVAMLLASCAVQKQSNGVSPPIVGPKWQLIELDSKPVAKINGKIPFLQLMQDEGRYRASGGCNSIGGEFSLRKKNGITFSRGMSTMMACHDMTIENGLRTVFETGARYFFNGDFMQLEDKDGKVLAKFSLLTDQSEKLVGTWELYFVDESQINFETLYAGRKPVITFDVASKRVHGNSSCNNFSGTVAIDGEGIRFGQMGATKMACPGSGEHVFFKNLDRVRSFSVQDSVLTMITNDTAVMRWRKK